MFGTIVNTAAILAGGAVGLLLKKGIPERVEDGIHKAMGVAVIVVGLCGVITSMITVAGGQLTSSNELLVVVSLVLGAAVGELLKIEQGLNALSGRLESRLHLTGFSKSFVSASLVFCVGAMAIIGSLNDGLTGDSSVLLVKAVLDGVIAVIFAATDGVGALFAAISVFLYQGAITLLAGVIHPWLSDGLLKQICAVGYVLVGCIGINFLWPSKIKTANLLPAVLVPPIWALLRHLYALVF